ncbi:MAG: Rpn family recombination-promoting nuclease/putative transposase, partial [Lachnospiraceae bacterium]
MPLRIIGYDGAAYRTQLLEGQQKEKFPVLTIVLYFGYDKHWDKPLNLVDCLHIPDELKPFISDYKIHLFEIAYLEDWQ